MPTGSIPQFLAWLASSAGLMAVASFLLERLGVFQKLTVKQKLVIVGLVIVAIPQLVLVVTRVVPDQVWVTLQPYWQALVTSVSILITALASEVAHKLDKSLTR